MHEACGFDQSTSLRLIGTIKLDDLKSQIENFDQVQDIGLPRDLTAEDRDLALQMGVDLEVAVSQHLERPFICHGSPKDIEATKALFQDYLPALSNRYMHVEAFAANFVPLREEDIDTCRGQVALILANADGHRIVSIADDGRQHSYKPKPGDLIFFDSHRKHAIIPGPKEEGKDDAEAPIAGYFASLPDTYD